MVKYVGSFDDAAAGKELAGVLLDQGADVIYIAAGKAGLGAIEAIKDRSGAYAIGVDVDQDGLVPGKILTSMIKRVDVAVLRLSRAAAAGSSPHGHTELGLADGAIGLSAFTYTRRALSPAQFHELDRLRAAIVAGTLRPPSTREALAAFKPAPA